MPLQHIKYISPSCIVGIWHLTETEEFFLPKLKGLVADLHIIESIHHEKRRTEWLAGRFLVAQLAETIQLEFDGTWTDEFNKPHLKLDNGNISLSHATPFVVAILNTQSLCGIDVERIRDKLLPLSPKFLSNAESSNAANKLENLAVLWGAKEALYKLHGRKSLIFKENLAIETVNFSEPMLKFKGNIRIDAECETYNMVAGRFGDYILVFTE